MAEFRSGFIAVVGRPNVGKSTLMNALVGHKISIVTSKPHTTRHAILGVLTAADYQLVFIDTPGLESRQTKLMNKAMNRAAAGALDSADLIMLVVEAGKWNDGDEGVLQLIERSGHPCVLAVNKIDLIKPKDKLLPFLVKMQARHEYAAIVPLSSLQKKNLQTLESVLVSHLAEQEALYSADMVTDKSVRFRIAEMLREKLMHYLRQELPYGLGVEITELEEDEDGRLCANAIIWVERESHKGIVVGKGGQGIKQIGTAARLELEQLLGKPVRLDSRVKVKKNWSDNAQALQLFGYDGEI